ncbi:MAG: alpha/beta hydrolase [Syntrophaceae bacterium]
MALASETGRISPAVLLDIIGLTPADNIESLDTAVPWKSKIAGQHILSLFHYQSFLKSMASQPLTYGPLAVAAGLQSQFMETWVTGPIKASARIATRTGRNPDVFGEINGWIYQTYAKLMYDLCALVMTDEQFDKAKALELSGTPEGIAILKDYMMEFANLELIYNSMGLTRLKAMKDLMKCLLMVITVQRINGDLPFMKQNGEGLDAEGFEKYLEQNRARFENLYRHNAFDVKEFSQRRTQGTIGVTPYSIVKDSHIHGVRLRYYHMPKGVKPAGKVLYLASPLINKPELFDLAKGKSVVEAMLNQGYHVYLVDHGDAGPQEAELGLDFYGKTVPDLYLDLIKKRHPGEDISIMGYCMGGTLMLAYLGRRAEERLARGEEMDVRKIALMASPVKFDDADSGIKPMRDVIRQELDTHLMAQLFGESNVAPQVIEAGMNEIQPGVQYTVYMGFYARAHVPGAIEDSIPFLYWLTHGSKFPAKAHREWIGKFFLGNELYEGKYVLPSTVPELDGKPVNMGSLKDAGVRIFCYRGTRDPIAPPGSCVSSEIWGQVGDGNLSLARGGLNRMIEKNIGHIFVVSSQLLGEYIEYVSKFLNE